MVFLESVDQLVHFSMFSMVWPVVLPQNIKMWFKENVETLWLYSYHNIALFILASQSAQNGNIGSTNGRDLSI